MQRGTIVLSAVAPVRSLRPATIRPGNLLGSLHAVAIPRRGSTELCPATTRPGNRLNFVGSLHAVALPLPRPAMTPFRVGNRSESLHAVASPEPRHATAPAPGNSNGTSSG